MTFCEAIARQEGWLMETSRCRRNNNPGNIRYGAFAARLGATSDPDGYAVFPTAQDGFNALSELLEANYAGMSVQRAISKYAPVTENNTMQYISDICLWCGLTPQIILTASLLQPPQLEAA